jgi:hypothetical protein
VKIKGELYWVSGNLPFNMLNQSLPLGVNSGLKIIPNDALFAITSLNPILRAPAEDAFDRNFFFRSTITKDYGDNLTPAPSWAVWLANAVPGFANEARLIKKPTKYSNGQDVWLMDNKWAWRFSQLAYGPLRLVGEAAGQINGWETHAHRIKHAPNPNRAKHGYQAEAHNGHHSCPVALTKFSNCTCHDELSECGEKKFEHFKQLIALRTHARSKDAKLH